MLQSFHVVTIWNITFTDNTYVYVSDLNSSFVSWATEQIGFNDARCSNCSWQREDWGWELRVQQAQGDDILVLYGVGRDIKDNSQSSGIQIWLETTQKALNI